MRGYGTTIKSYGTGTGGNGTYTMSTAHTVASPVVTTARSKSKIYSSVAGYFNFQFSAQLSSTSGGTKNIWMWPRINGVDLPESNSRWAISGTNAETVAVVNYIIPVDAGQYFQLMWAADSTNVLILREAATAFAPAIPSVILTTTFVSALY
jgi:hypothetical protein